MNDVNTKMKNNICYQEIHSVNVDNVLQKSNFRGKIHCHRKDFRLYFCVNIEYKSIKIVVKLQLESRTTGGMKSAAKFL